MPARLPFVRRLVRADQQHLRMRRSMFGLLAPAVQRICELRRRQLQRKLQRRLQLLQRFVRPSQRSDPLRIELHRVPRPDQRKRHVRERQLRYHVQHRLPRVRRHLREQRIA